MKPIAVAALGLLALLILALLLAVVGQAVEAVHGPSAAELARQYAQAQQIEQDAAIAAQWAPVRAALWNGFLIVAALGVLAYGAALAVLHLQRLHRERRPDRDGLLPVLASDQGTARAALGGFHLARVEESRRALVPAHYSPTISYSHELEFRGSDAAALLPGAEAPALASVPSFAQLLDGGRVGPGSPLLLGQDLASGEGVWGDWRDLYSAGLGGKQGSGKSWTAASLISQSLLGGARVVLGDIHAGDVESLATRLEPLVPAIELLADEPAAVLEAARYVHDEFQRRKALAKAKQPYDTRPLVLVIDEWTALLRGDVGDALPPLLAALTTEGRKYGVNALLLAQRWEAAAAGGSDVRNTLTAHYVHRMRGDEARMMTGLRASSLPDDTLSLQPGQAYLFDTRGNTRKIATPQMTAADLARVAELLASGATPPAAPHAPPPERRIGFQVAPAGGAPGGAPGGALHQPHQPQQDAPKLTAEELRIVAAFLAGKSPSELAAELNGGRKNGDGFNQAARRVAEILRRALGQKGGAA